MVCNARVDTALYGLPPAKTGKKGRPRKHGDRIGLDEIVLGDPKSSDWLVGMMPVITNLWKDKVVYALVTAPKTEKGAAVCSYAQLIQERFPLTGRTALTKQPVLMGQKISFICHWPGMAGGGTLKFLIMKGKPSGRWMNTGSAVRKGSNGW